MQQPCPKCGYLPDRPSRFCRQCGVQLFNENDVTTAPTRNYTANQPSNTAPNQAYAPTYEPGMYLGNQPPDTSRFYNPPAVQGYPMPPESKKSRAGMFILISLLIVMLLGAGISMIVVGLVRSNRPHIAVVEQIQDETQARVREEMARVQEEIARAQEEAARAREEALRQAQEGLPGGPPAPPAPPAPGEATSLKKYEYPQSDIVQTASIIGNEVLKLSTADSFAKVKQYYQKLAGAPITENNVGGEEQAVFKVAGDPPILITIAPDEDHPGKTAIVVLRSKFVRF